MFCNGLLGVVSAGLGWFWLVLVGLGWFWLVLVGLGWSWLVLVGLGWSWSWYWLVSVGLVAGDPLPFRQVIDHIGVIESEVKTVALCILRESC